MEWPRYLSLRNIDSMFRSQPSNLWSMLIALLPVALKYHLKGHGKTTAVLAEQIQNQEDYRKNFEHSFRPHDPLSHTGKLLPCVDGWMRQCDSVICAWMADDFWNIHLRSFEQPHCPRCEARKTSFGVGKSLLWHFWDHQLYLQKMILVTQGDQMERPDARQYLEDPKVGSSEGVIWNAKYISPTTIFEPDMHHTIYLGMLKHLMNWV